MREITVTRRLSFSAAHRLHDDRLSAQENQALFGKCSSLHGHGHNYRLDVSVRGAVDPRTGYVVDLKWLRDTVEGTLIDRLDHHNLNEDVDFLAGINPTTENVVVACWDILAPLISPGRLIRLRLWETENNYVDFEG